MNQILHFDNIHYSYAPDREVLRGVDLRLGRGEKVALVGANGAGKSTLLLHANGLLMPSRGQVEVNGLTLTPKNLPTIRQQVGLVFQNADDQLFMPSVEEDVAFGPANMHLTREEIDRRIERSLRQVGALDLRHRSTQQLSEGEKHRVAIATVLAMEPSVLIMDEPSAGLDPRARRQIIELLNRFEHTALIATHDLDLARRICPRTVVMYAGRVAADGPTAQVLDDESLLERYGL